ncbi:MAG: hypothetical protein V3T70_04085 [Phycisphaerae bacterium]
MAKSKSKAPQRKGGGRRREAETTPHAVRARRVEPVIAPIRVLSDWRFWAISAVLVVVTIVAFYPFWNAEFVRWDDPDYVMKNKLLRSWEGLETIWDPTAEENQQYYPMVFTSFLLEHRLAGLPAGRDLADDEAEIFHRTNLVIHLINVALVLALIRKFGLPWWVAAAVAAVFAVHPTQVASVVWVAERKNTLSGFFWLIAFLLYLRHRRTGGWVAYAGCLAVFVFMLMSKTQTLTFPISIFLIDWALQSRGRMRPARAPRLVLLILPMLALGGAAAKITATVERAQGPSKNYDKLISTPVQRPFIAANAAWFYAGKFLAPVQLAPVYPKWKASISDPRFIAGLIAWPAALLLLLVFWRRMNALVLWGMAHFFIVLGPALGLIPFNYQQYSYVADHFLYLACIGGGLALAVAAQRFVETAEASAGFRRAGVLIVGVGLLSVAVWRTNHESRYWNDNESFWVRALELNDSRFPGFYNLGNHYRRQNPSQHAKAWPRYKRASEISPTNYKSFLMYIGSFAVIKGAAAAVRACDERLKKEQPGSRMFVLVKDLRDKYALRARR